MKNTCHPLTVTKQKHTTKTTTSLTFSFLFSFSNFLNLTGISFLQNKENLTVVEGHHIILVHCPEKSHFQILFWNLLAYCTRRYEHRCLNPNWVGRLGLSIVTVQCSLEMHTFDGSIRWTRCFSRSVLGTRVDLIPSRGEVKWWCYFWVQR